MKKIACILTVIVAVFCVAVAREVPSEPPLVQAVAYDYTKLYKKISPSVFTIEADGGHGSGFLVDSRGLIATNHHVVRNTRFLAVKFSNLITIPAEILVLSARYDVAIIKVHESYTQELTPLTLISENNEQSVEPGLPVVAFGSPLSFSFLATQGIVSKVEENSLIGDFLIEPGNSGGPLVNLEGEAIGINTFGVGDISGAVRIGLLRELLSGIEPSEIESLEVDGEPLRRLPAGRYPTEILKTKIMEDEEFKEKHYTYGAKDFTVSVVTPVIIGQMVAKAPLMQAENRYKRRGRKIHDKSYQARDEIFYEWSRDAERLLDMGVTVIVSPKIDMTGGSLLLQVLGGGIGGGLGVGSFAGLMPKNYEFKGEFYDFRILRDGGEIKPVRPGRRLVKGGFTASLMSFMDEAYEGIYVYDPNDFMIGISFDFIVYDAERPRHPEHKKTFKADSRLIRKIRSDFREVLQDDSFFTPPISDK